MLRPSAAARQHDEMWSVGGGALERSRRCSDDLGVSRHSSLYPVGRLGKSGEGRASEFKKQ
jgi:hypothetical protein